MQDVLLLTVLCLLAAASGLDIYVDQATGVDNSTCWTGGPDNPCATLGLGLEGLQHYNHTTLWVTNGTYSLRRKLSETDSKGDYRFIWMTGIAISATHLDQEWFAYESDSVPVRVMCENDTGLAFVYSANITIRGIEFVGCGAYQYSTSRMLENIQFEQFYVALYFLYASDVTLEHVTIAHTPGTGVVMYATVGTNKIANSNFVHNSPAANTSGGGGLYIEFSYCAPALSEELQNCSASSNIPQYYVANSHYLIDSCNFLNNIARILNETNSTFILPHLQIHLAFGRGGGLSVFFKGNSTSNSISVRNSTFTNNRALWGAGMFVEYQDMSYNNSFSVESSVVELNHCFHHTSEQKGTGGGGTRLGHIFFNQTHASYNHMSFTGVRFSQNKAYYGGGLSFYTTREPDEPHPTNTLVFRECEWVSNVARVGSGVDLSVWHPVPYGAIAAPDFTDCTFSGNAANYTSLLGEYVGIGAFYSDFIPVNFYGVIRFEGNSQTALACIGAQLSFRADCMAEFVANSGRNGGAVALMGYSFIEVSQNTTLRFVKNQAEFVGGAIYAQSIGEHDLISSRNCFIRYSNIEVEPWQWEAAFIFDENTANSRNNSIYATSLLTCLWGGAYGSASTLNDTMDVFCWNSNATHPTQWLYSSNCEREIATSPARFVLAKNTTYDCLGDEMCYISINVIPGLSTVLPFYTTDDRQNIVTNATVLTAKVIDDQIRSNHTETAYINNTFLYISDNSILLHGTPNKSAYIKLETIAPRVISMLIKVNFSSCPPGMIVTDGGHGGMSTCECRGDYAGLIRCHSILYYSELRRGGWMGEVTVDNKKQYMVGECPYCSAFTNERTLDLPQDGANLTSMLCSSINRSGVLCGSCLPGYGPVVNGLKLECHRCPESKVKYNWVFYIMTEFLPITIFFFIVVMFNVSITSGPANAFVFFAQVLSTLKVDGDGLLKVTSASGVLRALYAIPYDIWNQNFFHPILPKFCLSPSLSTLQLLSTGYITALYPLLLVIVFSAVLWAYGRGIRPVVCLCRPLHRCFARLRSYWNLQRSIVHALATYIILSYTKLTLVSFTLLTSTPLLDDGGNTVFRVLYYDGNIRYMGPGHIPYVILSLFVLGTFVALPPIVLSTPSLIHWIRKLYRKAFHKDMDFPECFNPGPNLDQFLNAFHGCYKDGTGGSANNNVDCRWFAGLYFVLRLIFYLVFAFTPNWFLQYVIQQLVCIGAVLLFVILRPYKNHLFNVVDVFMFANLAAISTLSMFNFHVTTIGSDLSMAWSFFVQYILIFLPLVYMAIYVMYILCKKYGKQFHIKKSLLTAQEAEDADFLEYADEGGRYRDITGSYQRRALVNANRNLQNSNSPPSTIEEEGRSSLLAAPSSSVSPCSTQSSGYGAVVDAKHSGARNSLSIRPSLSARKSGEAEDESLVDMNS